MIALEIATPKEKAPRKRAKRCYKKLRKWQWGGLIGCTAGVVFAALTVQGIQQYQMGALPCDWILRFHSSLYAIYDMILSLRPYIMADLATAGSIIIFYGGYGTIVGRFQQVANPYIRWLLTGLSVLFLLLIYWFNFQVAMLFENI